MAETCVDCFCCILFVKNHGYENLGVIMNKNKNGNTGGVNGGQERKGPMCKKGWAKETN